VSAGRRDLDRAPREQLAAHYERFWRK